MVGWHHWCNGHESEYALGVGDGQGGLECCSPWGCKESDITEWLSWTELNAGGDVEQLELSYKNGNPVGTANFERQVNISYLNILLPNDPAIMFLDICPKEEKAQIHTKSCIWMFIAVSFIITQTCKQPKCPSVDKWTVVHPDNEILIRAKKKWTISPWKDVEET